MTPSVAERPARLVIPALPASRRICLALSKSPSASCSALLESIMPAPVASRRALTWADVISIWNGAPCHQVANSPPPPRRARRPEGDAWSCSWTPASGLARLVLGGLWLVGGLWRGGGLRLGGGLRRGPGPGGFGLGLGGGLGPGPGGFGLGGGGLGGPCRGGFAGGRPCGGVSVGVCLRRRCRGPGARRCAAPSGRGRRRRGVGGRRLGGRGGGGAAVTGLEQLALPLRQWLLV